MIIDSKYTQRANERQGGVGTESTILSNELYSKKGQNNILAVIAEPNAPKPTFYAGRIHVDLSDSDKYAEGYEKLVRWAYDKYQYERPKKQGTTPSFIVSDDASIVLRTSTEYRTALDAIEKGKANASGAVKVYLNKLHNEIAKLSIHDSMLEDVDFLKNLQQFQPHLFEFQKITESVCLHMTDSKIHKHFRKFFEDNLKHLLVIPSKGGRKVSDLALFEFINYQTFLYYVAILLKTEDFIPLKDILNEIFILPLHFHEPNHTIKHHSFDIFRVSRYQYIQNNLKKDYYSPIGSLLQDLFDSHEQLISFLELTEADLFLHVKSLSLRSKNNMHDKWWPHTGIFINRLSPTLRVFVKSENPSYFKEIENILDSQNLSFLSINGLHTWAGESGHILNLTNRHSIDIKKMTNYEKLILRNSPL